jgi:hypothetical protein
MDKYEIIKNLVVLAESDDEEYFEAVHAIALILPKSLAKQLEQLVNGPVWDGDVMCKSHREVLFFLGLAIRVCCKGEQGYTGATYTAWSILQKIKEAKP